MSLHNFNSNTKSWKMYTNTLTSISGDDLLVMPSYGKDLILEVSANNDIFFKKGEITKRFDNLVSDYLDMSFVREASFNSLNSQIQYIKQEISGNSVKDFITSGISNDLLIKPYDGRDIILEVSGNNEIIFKRGDLSYNLDDLIGGGGGGGETGTSSSGYIENNNDYVSFNILDVRGKIVFTDNSNIELYDDVSFNNVDISGALNVTGISVQNFITSGISSDLIIKSYNGQDIILEVSGNNEIIFKRGDFSYNLDDLIGGGSQSSDYATYNILDITGKIIFTDNSNTSGTSGTSGSSGSSSNIVLTSISGDIIPSINNTFKLGDISKNWSNAYINDINVTNIDVSGALNVTGTVSASNLYTKTEVDVSFVSKQLFDASLSSIQLTNVYTKTEVDVSFVSKQLFDASINALATSSGGGSSTSIYDTNIKILPDWTPIVEISNSLYNNLGFGSNLSFSKDGSTVASFVDYRTPGVTGTAGMVGRIIVYHYNGSSWVQKGQNLDGTDTHFGNGQRTTLSSDGNMIAIGFSHVRYIYNENGNWVRGGVRIYKYNLTTLLWEQMGSFLIPRVSTIEYGIVESELFGNSMSFSTDGTIIAIGAPYAIWYNGAVFIYKYETRNSVLDWYYSAMLFAIKFQIDINIFGGYQDGPDIWPNSNLGYQSFGELVALSSDGTVVAATAPYAPANDFPDIRIEPPAAGIVRIFKFNGSSWINTGRIVGEYENDGVSSISISLSGNGNIIAIGTHRNSGNGQENGHVRVYAWNTSDNSWNQLGLDIDGQGGLNSEGLYARTGNSISLSYDGTILAVSSINQGEYKLGRVYKWDGTSWNRYGNGFNPGNSIFLTSDGNKLASATTDRASIVIYNLVQNKIVSLNSTNLFCSDGYSYSYKKNDIKTTVYPTSEDSVHSEYYSDFPNKFTRTLYILQNGSLYNRNNTYGSFSDIRLKENIIDATPKLQDLLKVRVVNYNLKGSTNKQIGVLAQELEEIFPGLVETENSGEKYKSVKYSCINIMLVKALQEQQVLINDMSSNINTLKDEIATLKQNMTSLATRIQALEPNASQ